MKKYCESKKDLTNSNDGCDKFIRRKSYKEDNGDNIIINISGKEMACLNCEFWKKNDYRGYYPEI